MKLIVLAAGPTATAESSSDALPKCLTRFDESTTVLDRLVAAARVAGCTDVVVVGGYRILSIMQAYPAYKYYYSSEWERSSSLLSLLQSEPEWHDDLLIAYSDVVYDADRSAGLGSASGSLVVACDSGWATRYEGRTEQILAEAEKLYSAADGRLVVSRETFPEQSERRLMGEFAGLVLLRKAVLQRALQLARSIVQDDIRAEMGALVNQLSAELPAAESATIDFDGGWAELDSEQDLARFRFGTKSETLDRLRGRLSTARILPQYTLTVGRLLAEREAVLDET